MSADNKKPRIARRGVLRFVCGVCDFTVHPSVGVTYAGANIALGLHGWRIERRHTKTRKPYPRTSDNLDAAVWTPVCNVCATPDPKPDLEIDA